LGGTQDNGTWLYNNSFTWSWVLGGDGFFTEIDRSNTQYMYSEVYNGTHYRSTNGGTNFYPKNTGITEGGPWETPTWMDYTNPAIIWTAHNSTIFRTTDRMNTWVDMNNPTGLGGGRSIHQCYDVPSTVVVLGGARVWVTTDNGTTWANKTGSMTTGNTLSDVFVHPHDPNIMVVTLETYSSTIHQVYKTIDGGLNWTAIDAGLPDEPCNAIEMDLQNPDHYFVGTDLGVYYSPDAGATWVPFNTGLPHVVVDDMRLQNSARLLRVSTHGRGMWECDISGLGESATPGPAQTVQPMTLRIYGNPASDRTSIRYGTRRPGRIHLAIYDAQGREVKKVLDEQNYGYLGTVDVDVRDLPNGVYFARLSSGGDERSAKLVIDR
jgi:hypothetical protein